MHDTMMLGMQQQQQRLQQQQQRWRGGSMAARPLSTTLSLSLPRRCRMRSSSRSSSSRSTRVVAVMAEMQEMRERVVIVGGGPAAHTAATYLARAELSPVLFEGWMANGLPPGGQLTTTTYVENFPGYVKILGGELCDRMREQSVTYGTRIFTETVSDLDLTSGPPFTLKTDSRVVRADAVIIATGAAAKKLKIPGAGEGADGYWNRGISACAVCDGASPLFRNKPVGVVGGGDAAMEEALFLARYASTVHLIHRFDYFEASKAMVRRALSNPKIEVLYHSEVLEAYGQGSGPANDDDVLGGVVLRDNQTGDTRRLPLGGLFFAIGHAPATKFLGGQLELDEYGYVMTAPDSTATSIPGVFAAGDVQDRKWRQAITAAGSGCMAALEAERFLSESDAVDPSVEHKLLQQEVAQAQAQAAQGGGEGGEGAAAAAAGEQQQAQKQVAR